MIWDLEPAGWTARRVAGNDHVFSHPNRPGQIPVPARLLEQIDDRARSQGETRIGRPTRTPLEAIRRTSVD